MKSIQIELSSIEKKQLGASIKANGILKVPNQNKASVTTLIGGVVNSLLVQSGSTIKQGQLLATIANPSFVTMQEDFLNTNTKIELAQTELTRQKNMQQGNAGSLKNVQIAETELKLLQIKKMSLKKQLELIGINTQNISANNIQSNLSIVSPIGGSVNKVLVNIGSYVDANSPIAEIVDNNQLHLYLYVYEKDFLQLKENQTVHFTLTNNPVKEYDATIFNISNTFEDNTKSIAIHAAIQGDKKGLIDGMSATAVISLAKNTIDAVPSSAIINQDGKEYIFVVSKKENHNTFFEKIPIRKGVSEVGYSEITLLQEIPPKSQIVSKGAFFIFSKMNENNHEHNP
ncbi:MAG: efflux RND transporter periplasmic adaptor subunit [Bacteroidetes bacterium]|nr:efflux RND transporter periplasmic adaptor subunit [Bacteroidota bacterium]